MAMGVLLCGENAERNTATAALSQLSLSLDTFTGRAIGYLNDAASEEARHFGPFCTRVVLENGCAALVGRIDTFRLMYLSEFQAQPEYEAGKRARSSFAWTGDVVAEEKGVAPLWNLESDAPKISRALFSRHYEHIYWRPALERALDFLSSRPNDPLLTEVQQLDAERFIGEFRGRSVQLYSALSKGVHWEFFSTALIFDENTVRTLIRDTCVVVSILGLVSHFIPTAFASLPFDRAVDEYLALRNQIP